jgi:hypothetical protein
MTLRPPTLTARLFFAPKPYYQDNRFQPEPCPCWGALCYGPHEWDLELPVWLGRIIADDLYFWIL